MTGTEIDRPAHLATAFFAAQASEDFRKGEITAPLGEQAHGIKSFPLAAMKLQEAFGPFKQAMAQKEARRVHPPVFRESADSLFRIRLSHHSPMPLEKRGQAETRLGRASETA